MTGPCHPSNTSLSLGKSATLLPWQCSPRYSSHQDVPTTNREFKDSSAQSRQDCQTGHFAYQKYKNTSQQHTYTYPTHLMPWLTSLPNSPGSQSKQFSPGSTSQHSQHQSEDLAEPVEIVTRSQKLTCLGKGRQRGHFHVKAHMRTYTSQKPFYSLSKNDNNK